MARSILVLAGLVSIAALLAADGSARAVSDLKVGYVVDAGQSPSDRELFGRPYAAFIRAVKALGIEGRVVQVAPNQDPTGALGLLARQRYDLVVDGVANADALAAAAREFPETRFLGPDLPVQAITGRPKNVRGTVFRAGEAGYLAGYLAALMEKRRPGRDVIGSVGGWNDTGVNRWVRGYQAGARRADPGIRLLNDYSYDFSNPAKCRAVALSQIAKGAGVVFNVAGACGLGALAAAREKGVWGIGVDVDQSFLGPQILTSAVMRLDVAVTTELRRLVDGRFTTGANTVFDLRNGGVGLGRVSPRVPAAVLKEVERVRRLIIAGKIRVPRAT